MCICLLASCSSGNEKKSAVKGKVQSAPYELLVVANKDWLKTEAGQKLVEIVEAPISGLPQREGNFRVTYVNPEAFKGVFQFYANILVVKVDMKHEESRMTLEKDLYARPQVVEGLYAPTDWAFVRLLEAHKKDILRHFNENEFARERKFLEKNYNGAVMAQVKKQFGVSINVPQDVDDMKIGENFLWASASKKDFQQNVCIYTLPWSNNLSFEDVRDSVMKVNIPGDREDQWMETDRRTVMIDDITRTDLLVVRGLWDMRNDAMGGPFVSYCYVDTIRNRFLIVEGFVFAPDKKKRPIIRQLEAALQTMTFESGK
jgi:hypothetical protein